VAIGIDLLFASRRRLDYIGANSITPSRGAADCGEYREVAGAITSVIASPLSRQCGHPVVSPNEFSSTKQVVSLASANKFFQLDVPNLPFRERGTSSSAEEE
jgi:hypothetical protein